MQFSSGFTLLLADVFIEAQVWPLEILLGCHVTAEAAIEGGGL